MPPTQEAAQPGLLRTVFVPQVSSRPAMVPIAAQLEEHLEGSQDMIPSSIICVGHCGAACLETPQHPPSQKSGAQKHPLCFCQCNP